MACDSGAPPLLIASFFGHPEIVKQLLEKGADVNAKNKKGRTPLDTVSTPWNIGLEGLYKSLGKTLSVEVDLDRVRKARPEIVKLLRKHKARLSSEL